MKSKFGFTYSVSLLAFVLIAGTAFAMSVNRTVLVQRQPDVYVLNVSTALNTITGQTLVIWERHPGKGDGHSVWGQILQPDGKPLGTPFQIISSGVNPFWPNVAYDPDTNQFVLVYTKTKLTEFAEVYAIRLKSAGRGIGKPVLVSHAHNPAYHIFNDRPFVSYDPSNKSNIIIWTRYEEGIPNPADPKGIYGAILNPNLTLRRKPVLLETIDKQGSLIFGPRISDVTIHRPSGKLLLGQTVYTPVTFQSQYSLAQVDCTFRNPTAAITKLDNQLSTSGGSVDLMQLSSGQIATLFSQDDGIKKRNVNSGGTPSGPAGQFFAEPVRNVPLVPCGSAYAASNGSEEIAVLGFAGSESEEAQFWLQRANSKGKPGGSAIEIESRVDSVHGGTISALPSRSTKGHLYAVLYIEGERDQPPLVNQGSGLVLLRVNTAP